MGISTNQNEVVETVQRRVSAAMREGLSRREAYLEVRRATPELIRRFRKLATAEQLRDLAGAESEFAEVKRQLSESRKRIGELEAELALREPAVV